MGDAFCQIPIRTGPVYGPKIPSKRRAPEKCNVQQEILAIPGFGRWGFMIILNGLLIGHLGLSENRVYPQL